MAMDTDTDSAKHRLLMRDCVDRASSARRARDARAFQRHLEAFLFLGQAAARWNPSRSRPRAPIPRVHVLADHGSVARLLRECFIEHGFAAHVGLLPQRALGAHLSREREAGAILVTLPMAARSTRAAIREIREHERGATWPIIVLAHHPRPLDEAAALAIGASAYLPFPTELADYPALIAHLRGDRPPATAEAALA